MWPQAGLEWALSREGPSTRNASGGLSDATCPRIGRLKSQGPCMQPDRFQPVWQDCCGWHSALPNCGQVTWGKVLHPSGPPPPAFCSGTTPQQHPSGASHRPEMSTKGRLGLCGIYGSRMSSYTSWPATGGGGASGLLHELHWLGVP